MARLRSVSDIIKPLGGTNAVAVSLGLNPSVVSSWKARGHIPSRNWPPLMQLAREKRVKGITLALLANLAGVAGNGSGKKRGRRRRRRSGTILPIAASPDKDA